MSYVNTTKNKSIKILSGILKLKQKCKLFSNELFRTIKSISIILKEITGDQMEQKMYITLSDSSPFLFLKFTMNVAFITVFIW